MRHTRPNVTRFRVQFADTFFNDERNLSQELNWWIDFAMRKNVEILDFNVGMKFVTRVQMGMLRVLRLLQVGISNDGLQEIIRGCPLLKELEMYNCKSYSKLSLNAPNLETLILDTSNHNNNDGLIVDCLNLRSFRFTGCDKCFEVKDLSSLVDVTFEFSSCYSGWKEFKHFVAALKPVLRAEVASFSCAFVVVLFYCMQTQPLESSMNWKRVKLNMWSTEKHIPGLCGLLRNSPYLEELVIHLRSSMSLNMSSVKHIESELDKCRMMIEKCSSSSLKRVVIYNVSTCLYSTLVHLVRTLLENAPALAELKIYYKATETSSYEAVLSSRLWTEFCYKLPTFPKASHHVRFSLHYGAPP